MPNYMGIPGKLTPVVLTPPVTTNGGVTTDYISLKGVHRLTIIAIFKQAVAHATGIDPVQAQDISGTGAKAITNTVPIWANSDISLTNVLTRQADALTYNLAATATNQIVTMDIDPAGFDVAGGFDVLGVTVDNSAQATNFVSITALLDMRYPNTDVLTD